MSLGPAPFDFESTAYLIDPDRAHIHAHIYAAAQRMINVIWRPLSHSLDRTFYEQGLCKSCRSRRNSINMSWHVRATDRPKTGRAQLKRNGGTKNGKRLEQIMDVNSSKWSNTSNVVQCIFCDSIIDNQDDKVYVFCRGSPGLHTIFVPGLSLCLCTIIQNAATTAALASTS